MLPHALGLEQSSGQAVLNLVTLEESLHLSQTSVLHQMGMYVYMSYGRSFRLSGWLLMPHSTATLVMMFGERKAALLTVSENRGTLGMFQNESPNNYFLSWKRPSTWAATPGRMLLIPRGYQISSGSLLGDITAQMHMCGSGTVLGFHVVSRATNSDKIDLPALASHLRP